ncbi:MAG: HPr-rel-A system PqqD family peptide chaperone [Rubrivivax sp.]|nr:HPr-rel-A system PqqD family peptide chaperone [Rubrivivax sp.]
MTAQVYRLADGVVLESLDGTMFAVYSGLSGETHLLNETAVWMLEWLAAPGWHHADDVVHRAASEASVSEEELRASLGDIWTTFVHDGLVLRRAGPSTAP